MCDSGGNDTIKKPRLFIGWPNSGDPPMLLSEGPDVNIGCAVMLREEMHELLTGAFEDGEQIIITRKLMTDAEVDALPER